MLPFSQLQAFLVVARLRSIYFPKRARRSTPLRLFVDTAKELLLRSGQ